MMSKYLSLNAIREFYNKKWYASITIAFAVLMILMLFEVKNHRFRSSDFKVYYTAAGRLIHGENLYRPDLDGHYYYKYSPAAAAYFIPSTLFPVQVAKVLHWFVMAFMACLGLFLALSMVKPDFRDESPQKINNLILLLGLILGVHLEQEFFLGQVNHILLVMFLLIAWLAFKGKKLPAAILLAASIFIKPFGLIFLPYFLIRKEFKLLIYFFLFAGLFFLLPLPFTGITNFTGQYHNWLNQLSIEMAAKRSLLSPENDTIFSILARYTPLRFINFTSELTTIFQFIITAIVGILFIILYNRGRNTRNNYILETAFLIALIPLLSFTNHYAFQFIELAAFVVVFNYGKLSKFWQIVAVIAFIFTGINMHDLWGSAIWHFLNNISLVAVGAILLELTLVNLRFKQAI
jgi:hypothetical protein